MPAFKELAQMAIGKGIASLKAFDGLKDVGILGHEDIAVFCQELESISDQATVARVTDVIGLADDRVVRTKTKVIGHIKAVLDRKGTPLDNELAIFLQMYLHSAWGINARPDEVDEPESPATEAVADKPKRRTGKAAVAAAPPIEIGAVPVEEPGPSNEPKGDGSVRAARGRPTLGRSEGSAQPGPQLDRHVSPPPAVVKLHPTKVPGWATLLDELHALFIRYEQGERRQAQIDIRALVANQTDEVLMDIADRYVTERLVDQKVAKTQKFLRDFGVPVDPEPAAKPASATEPKPEAEPEPSRPSNVVGWPELLDELHAMFVRYEAGERRVLVDIRSKIATITNSELRRIASEYTTERAVSPRVAKEEKFLRHFGVPVDPEPAAKPVMKAEPPPSPEKTAQEIAWETAQARIDALFAKRAAGDASAARKIFAARDAIPDGDPMRRRVERYIDGRFAKT